VSAPDDPQTPTFLAVFMTLAASAFADNEFNRQVGQRLEKVRTTAYTYGATENGPWSEFECDWQAVEVGRGQQCGGGLVSLATGDALPGAGDWSRIHC
jgi:hypothetical protein